MRRFALIPLLVVASLGTAGGAIAAFTSTPASAPQAIGSATLAPASAVAAANGACVSNKSIQVNVTWTATTSISADGYDVLRATSAAGPYSSVGTVVGLSTTALTDTGVTFGTTYYYIVRSKKNAWRSGDSAPASVTTLSKTCK